MVQIKIRPAGAGDNLMIEKILGVYFLDRDDIPVLQFTVAETEAGNESRNENGNESRNENGNENGNESKNESRNENGNESRNENGNESKNEYKNGYKNASGKIVGCACYDISAKEYDGRRFGEVHTIAVMPSYKNRGIGKRLLKEVLRNLSREKDARGLSDTVYVRTTAPGFFRHEGFSDCGPDLKKELWDECLNCREYSECVQKTLSGKLSELLKKDE